MECSASVCVCVCVCHTPCRSLPLLEPLWVNAVHMPRLGSWALGPVARLVDAPLTFGLRLSRRRLPCFPARFLLRRRTASVLPFLPPDMFRG